MAERKNALPNPAKPSDPATELPLDKAPALIRSLALSYPRETKFLITSDGMTFFGGQEAEAKAHQATRNGGELSVYYRPEEA